jgi:hypothetical protein
MYDISEEAPRHLAYEALFEYSYKNILMGRIYMYLFLNKKNLLKRAFQAETTQI